MGRLFDPDGKAMEILTLISEFFILNLLWTLCCIPVVTAGAATAAMYGVNTRIAAEKDVKVVRAFFEYFRSCFKRGTIIGLVMLLSGIIVAGDVYIAFFAGLGGPLILLMTPVSVLLSALWLMEAVWVYLFIAKGDRKAGETMKNAMIFALARLPYTVFIIGAVLLLGYITLRITALVPVWLFVGSAMAAYGIALVFLASFPEKPQSDGMED